MWIPRYNLNNPEVDHSGFGEPYPTFPITDITRFAPFARTVTVLPDVELPQSTVYGFAPNSDEEPPYFLKGCVASFHVGYTEPFTGTVFLPEHAVFVQAPEGEGLIQESLWHSRICFSQWFRNDRSTNWVWRVDRSWPEPEKVQGLVNFCHHRMEFQYFHWFFDTLPRMWVLKQHAPHDKGAQWYIGPLRSEFQTASIGLFDVSPANCVQPRTPIVQFEHMRCPAFVFTEPLHTRPMFGSGIHNKGWSVEYVTAVRERAWQRYRRGPSDRHALLYVSRRDAEHRHIVNEDAVLSLLESLGFTIVEPGTLRFAGQVQLFANARVIVGAHGAGLTNILWSPPGVDVIELLPDEVPDPGYRFLANLCGHRHHAVMCRTLEHRSGPAFGDIEVNIDVLKNALGHVLPHFGLHGHGVNTAAPEEMADQAGHMR